MPTVNLGGRKIKVDDSFLSLSPADQQKTVDEIEASLGPALPPVQPPDAGESFLLPRDEKLVPPTPAGPATENQDELARLLQAPNPLTVTPGRMTQLVPPSVASGLTSTAMLPLDLPMYASRGIDWLAGKAANQLNQAVGAPVATPPPQIPIPSEAVKHGASWFGKQLGYEQPVPETTGEKTLSNVLEMGAGAAGGAGILSRLAKAREAETALVGARQPLGEVLQSRPTFSQRVNEIRPELFAPSAANTALPLASDKFIRPYAEQPLKTIIGDTAGGAAAGGALTGSQALPDTVREQGGGAVGTMADLVAMLSGGVSGGTLASAAMKTPSTVSNAFRASRPALDITVDPVTGGAVANRTADETARLLQSITSGNPRDVAAEIAARVQSFRDQGLPVPTTGLIPEQTDLGLAAFEKRARTRAGPGGTQLDPSLPAETRQQFSFAERDAAQRQAAADQVASTQQPGVDQTLFQSRAAERAQMELDARQRAVDQPTGQATGVRQAREGEANVLEGNVGATPGASSDIFDVYTSTRALERDRSQGLYSRPEFTEHVFEAGPLQQAANEIRANATGAAPVTPRAEAIIQRIETAGETGQLTGRELSILNKDIESEIKLALRDGQDFQQLKALKDGIAQTVTQLPRAHPAREAIDIAKANTAEVIQPNFREGAGGALDMRLKTNAGQVQPEEAGASFLNRGRDAEQLMRISALRGNTDEVAASARVILMDRLAQAGVVKNGVIDPDKLTQWRNVRANVIDQIPGLGDEVNGMIRAARGGAGKTAQYTDDIAAAEARLAQTQKDLAGGPVGKIADKTPQEAVASVMGSPNAAKNMAELRAKTGNNPEAVASLKAAVADHFAGRVRQIDTSLEGEAGVNLKTLVKDFNKHRETLVAAGFTPEEMQALQRAQTALLPLTKRNVQATVGSTTAESAEATMRPLELALKTHYGTLKGGSVFRNIKIMLKLAKGDTGSAVEQLATRAMFDPDLAQTLLTRDVKRAGTPAWNAELQKALRRNEIIKDAASDDEE